MDFVSMDDVTRNKYHLLPKEKINGVRKHGGCDSIHDITYPLEKINGVRKDGGCDSKHYITYLLRKKEMEFVSMGDVIQNTISLTY